MRSGEDTELLCLAGGRTKGSWPAAAGRDELKGRPCNRYTYCSQSLCGALHSVYASARCDIWDRWGGIPDFEQHLRCAGAYTEKVAEAAAANQDFVMGFICQTPAKWSTQVPPGETELPLLFRHMSRSPLWHSAPVLCLWLLGLYASCRYLLVVHHVPCAP